MFPSHGTDLLVLYNSVLHLLLHIALILLINICVNLFFRVFVLQHGLKLAVVMLVSLPVKTI